MEHRIMKHGEWYWVDKAVIQSHAREIGFLSVGVYHFLASMVDESQSCYPSQKYIAERTGCSRVSVNKAIKKLVENKLISVWKTPGRRTMYHLLPVMVLNNDTHLSNDSTHGVSKVNTNNNKGTRNNIKDIVYDKKSYPTKNTFNDDDLSAREKLLAKDLMEALGDDRHFARYLYYAQKYPEEFLRHILSETKATPESKIRKSRVALFRYLVKFYAEQVNENHSG